MISMLVLVGKLGMWRCELPVPSYDHSDLSRVRAREDSAPDFQKLKIFHNSWTRTTLIKNVTPPNSPLKTWFFEHKNGPITVWRIQAYVVPHVILIFFTNFPCRQHGGTKTKNVQNNIFLHEKLVPPSGLLWFGSYDEFCAPSNCESVTLERRPVQWRIGTTNLKIPFKRAFFSLSFGIWCSYAADKSSVRKKSRFKKNLITEIHATKATAACNISEGVVV